MSVEYATVGGYGFTVTEDEAESFLLKKGIDDSPYEGLFYWLLSEYPDLGLISIGNSWSGPTGLMIIDQSSDFEDLPQDELGMKKIGLTKYGNASFQVRDAANEILGEHDKYIGYQVGLHVY